MSISIPRTVKSGLLENLRNEIICGDLKPGQHLRLEEIAKQYDVSTMPVREALRDLEAEGLVEIFPHRGAFVTELSPDDIQDLYEIRALLEEKAARVAVPNLTEETLDELTSIVNQMDEHLGDVSILVALNHKFHTTLSAVSNRKQLNDLNHLLRYRSQHYLRAFIEDLGGMPQAQEEHRTILEACKQGDADKAAIIARDHVAQVGHAIVEYLRQRQKNES